MSYIKNQILSMSEDYENGFDIYEIANFYGYTPQFVSQVLSNYSQAYQIEQAERTFGITNHEESKLSDTL